MNQVRIPNGTRDLIGEDVRAKRWLQNRLHNLFFLWGYDEIMTPALEYYQTYNMSFAQLKDSEMYKFFDENGDILTLRMDMTVPIARVATSKLRDLGRPLRIQYASNVYKVRQNFAGKRSEVMDCGVELIGKNPAADLEILSLALEVMESLGFTSFTLEIGNGNFFNMAASLIVQANEDILRLADLIDRKSMVELGQFLDDLGLSGEIRDFFLELPLLSGGREAIERAMELAFTPGLKKVCADLMNLNDQLEALGYAGKISYDFGKVPHREYYTGIIFEGFVEGIGTSVLSGGRYDHLLAKFGSDEPACGFSVKLDYLIENLPVREPVQETVLLGTDADHLLEGMQEAAALRKEGKRVIVEERV